MLKKLFFFIFTYSILLNSFAEAGSKGQNQLQRKLEIQQQKQQAQQAKKHAKQYKGFQFCPTLKLNDPRTQILIGLTLASIGVLSYHFIQYTNLNSSLSRSTAQGLVKADRLYFTQSLSANSPQILSCEAEAKNLGMIQAQQFPFYVKDICHPGEYVLSGSPRHLQQAILIDRPYLAFPQDLHKQDLLDCQNYQAGIQYVEGIKDFKSASTEQFEEMILETYSAAMGTQSDFRTQDLLIMNPNIPPVYAVEKVKKHFKDSRKNLKLYDHLFEVIENQCRLAPELLQMKPVDMIEAVIGAIMREDDPELKDLKTFCRKFYTHNNLSGKEIQQSYHHLWDKVKVMITENPLRAVAQLHMGMVEIHGFLDGNGRVTRLMTSKLLHELGYPALPVVSEKPYSNAVYQSMAKRSIEPFETYLKSQICHVSQPQAENGKTLRRIAVTCKDHCEQELREEVKRIGL